MDVEMLLALKQFFKTKYTDITSTYDIWLANGHVGTIDDFLASMIPSISFAINADGDLEVTIGGSN